MHGWKHVNKECVYENMGACGELFGMSGLETVVKERTVLDLFIYGIERVREVGNKLQQESCGACRAV